MTIAEVDRAEALRWCKRVGLDPYKMPSDADFLWSWDGLTWTCTTQYVVESEEGRVLIEPNERRVARRCVTVELFLDDTPPDWSR